MASSLTHAAAGLAVAAWIAPPSPPRRVWVFAAVCAVLPDIDLIAWVTNIPNSSVFGHRALTHSIVFAIAVGAAAAWGGFRGPEWSAERRRLWLVMSIATMTHGMIDAFTTYGPGVELFAPFSLHRYKSSWQPLTDYVDGMARALGNELLWGLLPPLLLAWLGFRIRSNRRIPG